VSGADEPLVDLVVEEPGWNKALPDLDAVARRAVELALDAAALPAEGYAVVLLACDDARIAELNAGFRGKEGPTNVLSWPAFELRQAAEGARPAVPPTGQPGQRTPLGDIAIALQTVMREAESASSPLKNHVLHLILHGSLHLLGYDHERAGDAELMEGLERRALAEMGIPDPYA
jgi:probable rRNA maturation factor